MPLAVDGVKARSAIRPDTRTLPPRPSNRWDAAQTRDAQGPVEATSVEIKERARANSSSKWEESPPSPHLNASAFEAIEHADARNRQ
eukprot:2484514-Pleurochrysis_carterae.AAC.3